MKVNVMNTRELLLSFMAFLLCSISPPCKGDDGPVGPRETERLEMELRNKMAGYNCAFWPRNEKLKNVVPGKLLPREYTDNIQIWLRRVLNPLLMSKELDPNNWVGARKLYFGRNHIIGKFYAGKDPNTLIEFKAAYRSLDITIQSKTLLNKSASEMTHEKIKEVIAKILSIPEEKKNKIEIDSHIEKLAGVDVCYGKMFCEWTEKSDPFKTQRRWWSYIPFWYKNGMMFVSITTVEKGDLPQATCEERWSF